MPESLKKLPYIISAIAAIVVLLACIIVGADIYWMAIWVSAAIGIFLVIGWCIRLFMVMAVFPPEEEPESELSSFLGEMIAEAQEEHEEHGEGVAATASAVGAMSGEDGEEEIEEEAESGAVGNAFLDS